MVKVLIADSLPNEIYEPLFLEVGIQFLDKVSRSDLETAIADCEGLIVRSGTRVTAELLEKAPMLKIVGRAGAGVDGIDQEAATLRGVLVENTPDANSNSAAEHTMGIIYAVTKNIAAADAALKAGRWEKSRYAGREIKGKTLGIVGLGRIGHIVAKLAKGNGMEVIFYDPYISAENARKIGYTQLHLDDLLRTSDYVTLHATLTAETRGMIGARELALMKKTAKLINAARGELVNEEALYEAINTGVIAGAGIDVFEEEPYPSDGKLLALGNKVVVTPHLAASTEEAQTEVAKGITEQVIAYLLRGEIINGVNVNPFPREIKPYLELVERMGYFAGKLIKGPITNVRVTFYGELANLGPQVSTEGIVIGGLVGLLSEQVDSVNLVNAQKIAGQRGVSFSTETSAQTIDYRSMVSLEVVANGQEPVRLMGILYEKRGPRIVGLNGYDIEFEPRGVMLISSHEDRPGVLAHITGVLGEYGVNIATSDLGRESMGGKAVAVFRVDSPVPQEAMRRIADTSKGVYEIRQITIPEKLSPRL